MFEKGRMGYNPRVERVSSSLTAVISEIAAGTLMFDAGQEQERGSDWKVQVVGSSALALLGALSLSHAVLNHAEVKRRDALKTPQVQATPPPVGEAMRAEQV